MKRKSQMELSSTVIVTLIISVVVVTLGFLIVFKIVDLGNSQVDDTQEATQLKLQEYLASDKKMFIYNSLQDGKVDKNSIFGIGVYNRIGGEDDVKFKLKIEYDFYDENGESATVTDPLFQGVSDNIYTKDLGIIEKNVGKTSLLQVTPTVGTRGEYLINIYVCTTGLGDNENSGICTDPYKYKYAVSSATIKI